MEDDVTCYKCGSITDNGCRLCANCIERNKRTMAAMDALQTLQNRMSDATLIYADAIFDTSYSVWNQCDVHTFEFTVYSRSSGKPAKGNQDFMHEVAACVDDLDIKSLQKIVAEWRCDNSNRRTDTR